MKNNNITSHCEKKPAASVRLWRHQHNGRWLWTKGSDRRTLFTTDYITSGEMTVCLVDNSCSLAPKSNRKPY